MIQRDSNIIVVSRIQLLVNKNFFHLLFFDLIVKTSQNALHFGVKCSKLRWFLGLRPRLRWGAYNAPPGPLVGKLTGFLTSAIEASRLWRLQFPGLTCVGLYAKNS